MEKDLNLSLKRKQPDDSKTSKMNFERVLETLQSPQRKQQRKSILSMLQTEKPEEVFKNIDSERRGSTGLVIKSKKQAKKMEKIQKINESSPEKFKEFYKVYIECRNKSKNLNNDLSVKEKDYREFVTPIPERHIETTSESFQSENASILKTSNTNTLNSVCSPKTPQSNIIKIPSSLKRLRIARHKKLF